MRTFGMDEPMGCYEDIEAADAFVLWGLDMAEMHPVLWQRMADRRLSAPGTQVVVLSTYEHRSYELADLPLTFVPQTDLAILNYIANYIISNRTINRDFVQKHVTFRRGNTSIGYGLRPEHTLQKAAKSAADPDGSIRPSRAARGLIGRARTRPGVRFPLCRPFAILDPVHSLHHSAARHAIAAVPGADWCHASGKSCIHKHPAAHAAARARLRPSRIETVFVSTAR